MHNIKSPRHLLSTAELSLDDIHHLFARADEFLAHHGHGHAVSLKQQLLGKTVSNVFFNDSTRTRTSFEMAAKRLGADVINFPVEHSSLNKGESLSDLVLNLQAIGVSTIIMRHPESFALNTISKQLKIPVINAGDGNNEHPSQGLLDVLTMRRHKHWIKGLVVAICGDIAHSRVARSNIPILLKLGAEVRVIAPQAWLPQDYFTGQVKAFNDLADGICNADVVMMLRIQKERMHQNDWPEEKDYFQRYGLDCEKLKLAKADAIVMHPGPMNRGVEIDSAVADDLKRSVILDQVTVGVAMRMAILEWILK